MPPLIAAAAIAGAAAIITGAANYWQQRKNYKFQKKVQYETWNREDMGVRRRVEDLRAAGLSPVLAAGSAAPSGPISTVTPPQIEESPVQAALQAMTMATNISQTQAQTELMMAQKAKTSAEARTAKMDANLYEKTGVSPNASPIGKIYRDIVGGTGQTPGHITGALKSILGKQTTLTDKEKTDVINKNRGTDPAVQKIYDERMKKINPNYKAPK